MFDSIGCRHGLTNPTFYAGRWRAGSWIVSDALGRMSILRHSAWSAAAGIVLTGSRFAVVAILARRLSQGVLGAVRICQWLLDIPSCSVHWRVLAPFRASPRSTVMTRFSIGLLRRGGHWRLVSSSNRARRLVWWRASRLRRSLATRLVTRVGDSKCILGMQTARSLG